MSSSTAAVPSTCCRRDGGCVCAQEAKCSCGQQPALHCTCEKSQVENKLSGARCSCNQRPAGECTCSRSENENSKPAGSACACGKRSQDACNCGGSEVGKASELETDFTTKAAAGKAVWNQGTVSINATTEIKSVTHWDSKTKKSEEFAGPPRNDKARAQFSAGSMSETNVRLIEEPDLEGSFRYDENVQMTSLEPHTQPQHPDAPSTKPAHAGRTVLARLGSRVVVTLLFTFALELAVFSFLAFLWFSPPTNPFWHWIAIRGYVASAVTASSFLIRIAVDLQASVAVAMLAALLLETDFPLLLTDTARISKLRAGSAVPLDLLLPYARSLRFRQHSTVSNSMYAVAVPTLVATTLLLQLTSTTLVSDLSLGTLQGPRGSQSLAFDLKYLHTPDNGPPLDWETSYTPRATKAWLRNPHSFPTFAEYQEDVEKPDNVDDTGRLFRALLPFRDAQSRETLSYYSGKALVLDARVSCQRPLLKNLTLDYWGLSGSYMSTESVPRLQAPEHEIPFNCQITTNSNGPTIAICQAHDCEDGKLISEFWGEDGWLDAISRRQRLCEGADASYLVFNVSWSQDEDGARAIDTKVSGQGAWTTVEDLSYNTSKRDSRHPDAPEYTVTRNVSVSLCYPAFWLARLDVELMSAENRTEPVPQMDEDLYYTTPDIHDQMGAHVPGRRQLTLEQRGTLGLSPMKSWIPTETDSAHWDESVVYEADFLRPAKLPDNRPYGVTGDSLRNISCLWQNPPSWSNTEDSLECPDIDLASIFTGSLNATDWSAASALSTIMTILTSMTYYDQMPRFAEVVEDVALTFFEPTLFPQSLRGLSAALIVTTVHCLLVIFITLGFIASTRFTQLGNHWQTVSQLVSPATQSFLVNTTHSTDRQVKDAVVAEGREHNLVSIVEGDSGSIGVVARKSY
ncbi:hypothetical protein Q7P37_003528 [Cladosporium fusiforme]